MVSTDRILGRLVDRLRRDQQDDGAWVGELSSGMLAFYYASSLILDGEPAGSEVIQDLCDFAESCATNDGAVGIYPGMPADAMSSLHASLLLGLARPHSPVLARLRERDERPPSIPLTLVSRWIFEPSARASILREPGPATPLRHLAMATWPRAWSYFSYRKIFSRPSRPSRLMKPLVGSLMRWMFWPVPGRADQLPGLLAPHMTLAILPPFLALRELAGDRSTDAFSRFTRGHMADYRYDDGSVLYLNYLPSYMLCAQASGDAEERRLLSGGLRRIQYRTGGWLRGSAVATSVLDTAQTVRALLAAGLPASDSMITRATSFLRDAQSDLGEWSWSWEASMGRRFRTGDTDDTGAACAALLEAGLEPGSPAVRTAASALERLQSDSGGFNTFSIGQAANTVTVSNTSRALQALALAGHGKDSPVIQRGCNWLIGEQEPNGRWVDYWMARWIYGTVTAMKALVRTGYLEPGAPALERGLNWLLRQQNRDGGWGEDWQGVRSGSTAEHTAMAVFGLCLAARPEARPIGAIERGLAWLADHQRVDGGWDPAYVGAYSLLEGYSNTQIPLYWTLAAVAEYQRMMAVPEKRVTLHQIKRPPRKPPRQEPVAS
jgi:hypothetical protein